MRTRTYGENPLYELAQTLAAGNDHATAIALRKLVQAGYTTLQQVDGVPDWILLSIPGMGVKRLGAVRRLTRPDWQPPSQHAVRAANWYLSAAQFAFRYWPPDTLASVVRGYRPGIGAGQPLEARLALDVFARATTEALRYCDAQDLLRPLHEVSSGYSGSTCLVPTSPSNSDVQNKASSNGHGSPSAAGTPLAPAPESGYDGESDHYAYPRQKRRKIVQHFRMARNRGEVKNKEAWAEANYNISGRTLFNYEREFSDTERDG
jgi:hypothetical protein